MELKSMTTDQIKALHSVYEATLKAENKNRIIMREHEIEENIIRMYEMSPYAHEWFESLEEELKRRDEVEAVAELIYKNMFSNPDSANIDPLSDHRNDWERDMIYRQAKAVIGYYKTKDEPLAQWEIDLLESGKDEK
jgi:hypothetical protein